MMNILALFPITGNGGIASWARKYITTFPNETYSVFTINISSRGNNRYNSLLLRALGGLLSLIRIKRELKSQIKKRQINILHATTSGHIGSYRDIIVAKICKRYGVKSILHCHYGCITEDIHSKGLVGILVRKSLTLYDQIWVLDGRSYRTILNIPHLATKVHMTPNPIEINEKIDRSGKTYRRVAFIGNLIPSKGIYELVQACLQLDVHLDIIGPGADDVINKIREIAGNRLDDNIILHGCLPNECAIAKMKETDIVVLPTYYISEAFPISILEAMSLTKMVISCPRGAIPDMLEGLDGKSCGMLVRPHSVDDIVQAIRWCQQNPNEADKICSRAYEKVYATYRKEVVYDIYRDNYNRLLK